MNRLAAFSKIIKNVRNTRYFSSNIYEPDYLESMKPPIPIHEAVNIQIRGYDYAVLENYQKLIHSLADSMEIEVDDCWAMPAQHSKITTFKPNSEILDSEYLLKTYSRTTQVCDISTTQVLIRALEASTPVGVSLHIENHTELHEEDRYIPDKELLTLKQELEDMGGPRKVK